MKAIHDKLLGITVKHGHDPSEFTYDAIVDGVGADAGFYATFALAIAAGAKSIFALNGTYSETLTIASGDSVDVIVGEDRAATIATGAWTAQRTVQLQGLNFQNTLTVESTDSLIYNNSFTASGKVSIIFPAARTTILLNDFNNGAYIAIATAASTVTTIIRNNTFRNYAATENHLIEFRSVGDVIDGNQFIDNLTLEPLIRNRVSSTAAKGVITANVCNRADAGFIAVGKNVYDISGNQLLNSAVVNNMNCWTNTATVLTDRTTEAKSYGGTPFTAFGAVGDVLYVGHTTTKMRSFMFALAAYGNGTNGGVVIYEYWNGSAWTSLAPAIVSNQGNINFRDGDFRIRTAVPPPTAWAKNVPEGAMPSAYWMKVRVTTAFSDAGTATGATTGPPGTLTDTGKAWTTNQWAGLIVTAGGQTMTVASNTATVLTGTAGWSGGGNPGAVAYTLGLNPTINQILVPGQYFLIAGYESSGSSNTQLSNSIISNNYIENTYGFVWVNGSTTAAAGLTGMTFSNNSVRATHTCFSALSCTSHLILVGNSFFGGSNVAPILDCRGQLTSTLDGLNMTANKFAHTVVLGLSNNSASLPTNFSSAGNSGYGLRGIAITPEVDTETDLGTSTKRVKTLWGFGGVHLQFVSASTDITLTDDDLGYSLDATGATRTVTLPAATKRGILMIWKSDNSTNPVIVQRAGSDLLELIGSSSTSAAIGGAITNTLANPTVVTTTVRHGLVSGDVVSISGSNSTPVINGTHTVTVISTTTFSVPVNVTTAGTAGVVVKLAARTSIAIKGGRVSLISDGVSKWYGFSTETGGLHPQTRSVTADTQMTYDDFGLIVDASGGTRTVTLPSAAEKSVVMVWKSNAGVINNVVVQRSGSDTIESVGAVGGTSLTITNQNGSISLVSDGVSAWRPFGGII